MPNKPAAPVVPSRDVDPVASAVIDDAPVSPFGLLVVEGFDRGMPVSDWIGFYRYPDPRVIAALDDIWRKEVWPAFTAHFGIA